MAVRLPSDCGYMPGLFRAVTVTIPNSNVVSHTGDRIQQQEGQAHERIPCPQALSVTDFCCYEVPLYQHKLERPIGYWRLAATVSVGLHGHPKHTTIWELGVCLD